MAKLAMEANNAATAEEKEAAADIQATGAETANLAGTRLTGNYGTFTTSDAAVTNALLGTTGVKNAGRGIVTMTSNPSRLDAFMKAHGGQVTMGSMIGSMILNQGISAINGGKSASEAFKGAGMNATGSSLLSTSLNMAPMIGMAIGGPIGAAIGAGVGVIGNGVAAIVDSAHVTNEELEKLRAQTQEALTSIREKQDKQTEIENQANEIAYLSSGVDQETGENISLTKSEYEQYQKYLKEIAEELPGVTLKTDAKGNSVLLGIESVVKAQAEREKKASEEVQKEAEKQNKDNNKSGDIVDQIKGGLYQGTSGWSHFFSSEHWAWEEGENIFTNPLNILGTDKGYYAYD